MSTSTQIRPPETSVSFAERSANVLTALLLLAGVCAYGLRNLSNTSFWSDEASSFYTSLGWPPPGEVAGSLSDAWYWTLTTHVEPGLFNLIERFWALSFGTEIHVLRLIPFALFVVYLGAIITAGRLLRLPWFLANAVAGVMLLENITPYYGVELRPSIAGLAASVALPVIGIWFSLNPSGRRLALFVVGVVFFGSMQFNSLPILVAVGVMLVVAAFLSSGSSSRLRILAAALLAAAWQPVVYLVTRGNPMQATGESSLSAIPDTLIPNMSTTRVLEVVATNFLSPTALPRTIFLVVLPVLWIVGKIERPWDQGSRFGWSVNALWTFVITATLGSAAIGIRGVMPWILGTRWSIAEIGLIAVSLVGLVGLLAHLIDWRRSALRWVVIAGAVLVAAVGSYRVGTYERPAGVDWRPAVEVILSGQPGGTIVDLWTYPEIRYWLELSGDYESFTQPWLEHKVQPSVGEASADTQVVRDFLTSDADRLLLRNQQALEGVTVPDGVEIIALDRDDAGVAQGPVLIVK